MARTASLNTPRRLLASEHTCKLLSVGEWHASGKTQECQDTRGSTPPGVPGAALPWPRRGRRMTDALSVRQIGIHHSAVFKHNNFLSSLWRHFCLVSFAIWEDDLTTTMESFFFVITPVKGHARVFSLFTDAITDMASYTGCYHV